MGHELRLDTAQGNHVPNVRLEAQVFPGELARYAQMERKYGTGFSLIERAGPDTRYNCHGLAFACRRTAVEDVNVVLQILAEDRYREVKDESALPGDVLLYFGEHGEIEHSAIILESPEINKNMKVPLVISKWGNYKELIHRASDCPYRFLGARYFRMHQQ